jgi:hypothetical protein
VASIDWTEVSIGIAALLIFVYLVTKLVKQFSMVHEKAWREHRIERGEWRDSELLQRERTDAVVSELADVIRDASRSSEKTLEVLESLHRKVESQISPIPKKRRRSNG